MRASELNLAAHAAHLHPAVPGATVRRYGDFQVSDSGLEHDTYNIVSRAGFAHGFTEPDVAAVADYVRSTGRPFSWWVADDAALTQAIPALSAVGFQVGEEKEEAMFLPLREGSTPLPGADADVRRVDTADQLRAYASILAANWDPPAGDVEGFLSAAGATRNWRSTDNSRFYVAYVDDIPAAGAEVYIAAGVAGVYGVATLQAYRGRGLATQLMARVLRDLETSNVPWAILQATAQGSPIYRRFGFRTVGTCTEFTLAVPRH